MRKSVLFLLMAASMLLASLGLAQEPVYRLQPQDVIRIQVYKEPEASAVLPIGRDGNISAPFVGLVHAAGKTTSELEADLSSLYEAKLRMIKPKVSVTIEQYRPIRATVGGMVAQPGIYDFHPGDTINTLLQRGGGSIPDRSDLHRATLRRAGSREVIPIDLHAMMLLGDTSQNYVLEDGDELTIPEDTRNRILVLGAIQAPGTYPYKEPMYLADAISMAKGPIPIKSKMSQIIVMREQPGQPGKFLRIRADWVKFIRKGDNSQNILLLPGDLIYCSETNTPDLGLLSGVLNSFWIVNSLFRR